MNADKTKNAQDALLIRVYRRSSAAICFLQRATPRLAVRGADSARRNSDRCWPPTSISQASRRTDRESAPSSRRAAPACRRSTCRTRRRSPVAQLVGVAFEIVHLVEVEAVEDVLETVRDGDPLRVQELAAVVGAQDVVAPRRTPRVGEQRLQPGAVGKRQGPRARRGDIGVRPVSYTHL